MALALAQAALATLCAVSAVAALAWLVGHVRYIASVDEVRDQLRMYRSFASLGHFLRYLPMPHNDHRILTTRVLGVTDLLLSRGRGYTQLAVGDALQLGMAAATWRFAFAAEFRADWTPQDRLLAFGAILLCFMGPAYFGTLGVALLVQYGIMSALTVGVALVMAKASAENLAPRAFARLVLILAVLAAVGCLTLGDSPALTLSALAAAVALRWPARRLAVMAGLAAGHLVLVILTMPPERVPHPPLVMAQFFLVFLGGPFLRAPENIAYVIWPWEPLLAQALGLAVLVTGIAFGVRRMRRPGLGGRLALFGLALLAAVVAVAAAAAWSRGFFGAMAGAGKRYSSFSVLGWLGVLAIVAGVARGRAVGWTVTAATAVLLLFTAYAWSLEPAYQNVDVGSNREAAAAVFVKADVRDALNAVYDDPADLKAYVGYLEGGRQGVFSRFHFRYGDNADKWLAKRRPIGCRGETQPTQATPADDRWAVFDAPGQPASISGWTWMTDSHGPPESVIAVDAARRIVGLALPTRRSVGMEQAFGRTFPGYAGWYGYARVQDGAPVTEFIALSAGERTYCRLGAPGSAVDPAAAPAPGHP